MSPKQWPGRASASSIWATAIAAYLSWAHGGHRVGCFSLGLEELKVPRDTIKEGDVDQERSWASHSVHAFRTPLQPGMPWDIGHGKEGRTQQTTSV